MMQGIKALWKRELIRFTREKSRIITSIFTPLLWIFVFGSSLGANISLADSSVPYEQFMFPGIIGMAVLFSSIFFGVSVIWDRQFGFLKEILVAPISRLSIFLGKVLGGVTISMIQAVIVLLFGFFVGIDLTVSKFLLVLPFMVLTGVIIVSAGLIIGSKMKTFESFNMVMSFLVLPLFFFSGALYPLKNLPFWISLITFIDPLTYAVDGMRAVLIGVSEFPFSVDLGVLIGFSAVLIFIGQKTFQSIQ